MTRRYGVRIVKNINEDWRFIKENIGVKAAMELDGESVDLPHTWNASDGQDGGNDYYRGKCWYVKELTYPGRKPDEEVWLEFRGVAMRAEVYVNGIKAGAHDGGYSTFRVHITEYLEEHNVIAVSADNSYTREVYPQKADFTFYGGIYRDVSLLSVPKGHFELGYFGRNPMKVTPEVDLKQQEAKVHVEAWTENVPDGTPVTFTIAGVGVQSAVVQDNYAETNFRIEKVHLWNGKKDPYLYTASAELPGGADRIVSRFGVRDFYVDSEKGFFLNGVHYPLCGVSRHQDRRGAGNALTKEMHREDMEMIKELGANTIRLAHYQHDQYFYDLCDEEGMIVWAEIPYITEHMPEGKKNTVSQMTELVVQNWNHPSVVCWCLSNEITTTGGVCEDLVDNHRILNELCHELDGSRPTTMANVFILETDSEVLSIPDIRSYNLYYGWYVGEMTDNDTWFDEFHKEHPDMAVGLSEYGADATICYQTGTPEKGDYTEQYQATYHEHMLEMWSKRPYIWAMHVWNMFDFAADGREDGGEPGVNHKGLVTFDRKVKKDAFYIYKAYLSDEPFVHICGRRYVDRAEEVTEVKVYSNQPEVTLYVDREEVGTKRADKVFVFRVPISREHTVEARCKGNSGAQEVSDRIIIRRVAEPNPAYSKPKEAVVNWFDREDMQEREGYFSIRDSIASVKAVPEAAALLQAIQEKAVEAYGDVAKNVKVPESIQRQMDAMPVEAMLKQAGKAVTAEMAVALNRELNKIKKPEL